MHSSKISPWCNAWSDIYDFTPNKVAASGEPNFFCSQEIEPSFCRNLEEAKKLLDKASSAKGTELTNLAEIEPEDVE